MRASRGLAVVSAVVGGLAVVGVDPLSAQSFSETLATAYATNPNLMAARAELRSVNEGVPQALSNWRPDVEVTGFAGVQEVDSESRTVSSNESTNPVELRATLSQPLYRGGRTVAGTARAENNVLAQRARLDSVEQLVLLRAATAYMDVWRDHAVLGLNEKNEQVLIRQLEAARDRFEVGEITRTDVAQAETRLAVATADRIAAEGDLESSRAVFVEVVGVAPGELSPPPPLAGLPAGLDDAVQQATGDNPDVVAATFAERAAQRRVREVEGELLPTVTLDASVRHTEERVARDSQIESAELLAMLVVPLYQQGAVSSRVREAKQLSSQRRIEITVARKSVTQEAVSAWQALASARAQIVSLKAGVRSAEIALEGVRQENEVGARTILDILDAEQELLDASVDLVRSQRDETVAGVALLSSVGHLTADDMGLQVDLYDPQLDYLKVRNSWFGLDAP